MFRAVTFWARGDVPLALHLVLGWGLQLCKVAMFWVCSRGVLAKGGVRL
ncbi:hypothetical protein IMCC12053_418 [Celeribacter marinus]|uniref:Uncharacterized protein n=1 Tax=Celeribacter marinus TaxID=1397108 RepID=A0A0N9ZFF0_9RHOB|nr:hypothetical protein IMCC12053_418 [Celeribacter marinus]